MLYFLLKSLTNIFYRIFYKYKFKGHENIPTDRPIVFAPNHTNGFIDPIVIAMVLSQKIRFFARGDVFKGRLAKWAFNSMNMSPIYRLQEGYSEIKKNDKTFEECRRLLAENKALLIFPEAICVQEQRLQPLKKGLSRIIFQTEESFDFKKEVVVIPIGINYSFKKKFRSHLFVEFGVPISLVDYKERYTLDKVRTINTFTKILQDKISELIITIDNADNDRLVKNIEEIYWNEFGEDGKATDVEKKYLLKRKMVNVINHNDVYNSELIKSINLVVSNYNKLLTEHKLRDHLFRSEIINKTNIVDFFIEFFVIWIGTPFYLLGLIFNYLPFYIAKRFSDKKIKKVEFYDSVCVNISMILWLIYFLIQLIVVMFLFHNWILLFVFALSVILLGSFLLFFYSLKKKITGRWRLLRLVRHKRNVIENLIAKRADIIEKLIFANNNYDTFSK